MKRLRIVLDTNVLISAVLFGGTPRQVLELIIAGKVECSISVAMLDELRDVLLRPKFGLSAAQTAMIVEEVHAIAEVVSPNERIDHVVSDPDDNMVLECAVEAKASVVVTGDSHLLDLQAFQNVPILSPADFLKMLTKSIRR